MSNYILLDNTEGQFTTETLKQINVDLSINDPNESYRLSTDTFIKVGKRLVPPKKRFARGNQVHFMHKYLWKVIYNVNR